jgi:hypothetical protein
MRQRWGARRETIGQRLELIEGKSPRVIKATRCTSAELLLSCCGSVAARGQNKHFATAPARTKRALHGAHSSRGLSGKTTSFSRSGYTRACHRHFMYPLPNIRTEIPILPAPFLPRVPRLQAASSREIFGYAGGPVRQPDGHRVLGVVHDERGIGGDGEYCGDNDAHFDRINVLY